jgi:hypothetical protein
MSDVPENRSAGIALNERAMESLEFIRTTMARSAPFTAVSGRGGIAMGILALVAAALARSAASDEQWLATWIGAAVVAVPVGFVLMRAKAQRYELAIWSAAGRRFAQGFAPSIVAGAVLTIALVRIEAIDVVPATWLLLYGAGVLAGSSASVPVLAWLGGLFMVLGGASLVTPTEWRDLWLAGGFGVLQIAFGAYIARNHGG